MGASFTSFLLPAFEPTDERYTDLFNVAATMEVERLVELCDSIGVGVSPESEGSIAHGRYYLQREILALLKRAKDGFIASLEGAAIVDSYTCKDVLPVTSVPGFGCPCWIQAGWSWGDPVSDCDDQLQLLAEQPFFSFVLEYARADAANNITWEG